MTRTQPRDPVQATEDELHSASAAGADLPLHQLMGRHLRLTRELAIVCAVRPLDLGRVNRLSIDIAETASQIPAPSGAEQEPLAA